MDSSGAHTPPSSSSSSAAVMLPHRKWKRANTQRLQHSFGINSRPAFHLTFVLKASLVLSILCISFAADLVNASQALTFTIEPQDVVVAEGHSVLLQCAGLAQLAKNQKTSPNIRWRGPDGHDLGIVGDTFRNQLKNGSLYISSVEENRGITGSYQCLLSLDGIGTIVSRSAIVSIARLPDLNQDFIETYLLPGQTAYFRCMIGQMQQGMKHVIQWIKDDMPLQMDKLRMVILPNGALEIDEVTFSDRGVYQCNVTSGSISRLSSKTSLNMKKMLENVDNPVAPSFLVGPSPQTVKEGDVVTLDCVANGVPKPQIKWLRNGEELDLNDLDSRFSIIGTGSLQISSAEDIDSGNYQCRASNTVDSLDAQATVQVQVPPKFIQSPKDKMAYEKEELELECAIRGKPKPVIKWLKNGDFITPNDYMQIIAGHNLRILGLLQSDAGMFQCVGTNPAGSVQAGARLRVLHPGKLKNNRKTQSQTTKSLYLDYGPQPPPIPLKNRRKNKFNSGEVRTKSGDSVETTRIISKSSFDSLLSQKGNKKFNNFPEQPMNDRHFEDLMQYAEDPADGNLSRELSRNIHDYEKSMETKSQLPLTNGGETDDDDDYDDPTANEEFINAYKNGHDPNKILNSWTNKRRTNPSLGVSNSPEQTSSRSSSIVLDLPEGGGSGGLHNNGKGTVLSSGLISRLPGPPRDLVAQIVKPRFVTLSWIEPIKNPAEVVSYTVYYKMQNSERELKLVTKSHDDQQVNIQSLIPGRTYLFRVVANTNFGPGDSSEPLEVLTQPEENIAGPPTNVEGYARNHKEIYVKWQEPTVTNGEILKYRIYYSEGDNGPEMFHDSTALDAVLTELRPYTDYTITVVPFNKNGMGDPSNEIRVKTFSSMPSEPPNNVTLEVTSSTSITIHWEPPSEEERNGQITGYKIRYRKLKDAPQVKSTPANIRYYELGGLDRNSEYQVKIAAMTVNGSGPFTEWYRVMTLENDLDETQVPGRPVWMGTHAGAGTIALHWGPPQQHEIKIRSYVLGWGRGIPDENTVELKETDRYYELKDLEANTEYVVSLRARNIQGDGPPVYDNIKTTNEDPIETPTPLEVPVGLRAITMSSSSIVLYWIDTKLSSNQHVTDNRHYVVRYGISSPSPRYRYQNASDQNTMVTDLRPNTQYEFSVKVVKGRRESDWSMAVLNTTYQNVPITPPRELSVQPDEQNPLNVILQWMKPKHTVYPITGYNIYYTTDTTKRDRDWNIQTFSGEETSFILPNLKPYTTYYFKVQARTNKIANGPGGGANTAPFSALVAYTTGHVVVKHEPATISGKGINNEMILYMIIFGFALILFIVVAVIVIMCRRKPQSTPEHTKKSLPSSNSYQKNNVGVPKPPDLWIHHDQMELKNIDKTMHGSTPGCSDAASSSGALTLPRSVGHDYEVDTPVPNHITNSLDKRSYVPGYMTTSLNSTMERPQYPRTQYNIPANRSHMNVDTGLSQQSLSQPQNNSLAQTPEHPYGTYDSNFCNPGYTGGPTGPGSVAGGPSGAASNGGVSTIESTKRGHPLKSFSVPGPPPTGGTTPVNKHTPAVTIRPQNQSPYKKPSFSAATPNRLQSGPSVTHSNDEIQRLAPSTSTEELNQEMANLEGLMKDLSAITANEFEC
ncbi:neogenin isoform X1 [Stomoxys calcitrans]|uniref:neogenin isoform X1 n=1 Tax=Stomoxys calcitrans TaxID=35570 RepID=UPI0027E24BBA|nr:neogenin isoform X1 [Stomoxys calcitrans]